MAPQAIAVPGWPFNAAEAQRRQTAAGGPVTRTIDLSQGLKLELVHVPAGEYVMGDAAGYNDERTLARVRIEKAFWMGKFEVSNAQYATAASSACTTRTTTSAATR